MIMRRKATPGERQSWRPTDTVVQMTPTPLRLAEANPGRDFGCVMCGQPIGDVLIRLVAATSGLPCDDCGAHLLSAGFYCHERCLPLDSGRVVDALIRATGQAAG